LPEVNASCVIMLVREFDYRLAKGPIYAFTFYVYNIL